MTIKSHWRIFITSNKKPVAQRITKDVANTFGHLPKNHTLEPYYKGGYILAFEVSHEGETRSEAIVRTIQFGQRIARGWELLGTIEHEPSGWSNSSSVVGIDAVGWDIREPNIYEVTKQREP